MSLTILRPVTPALTMPDGPRRVFERQLQILRRHEAFEDRIYAAQEICQTLGNLAFAAVIDQQQHAQALRQLRSALQLDLGVVVAAERFNIFEVPPMDEVTP